MLGSLGIPEVLFIFVIALLVFGPRRLPEIGRTLGKALGEFRRATTDLKRTFDAEAASIDEDTRPVPAPERAPEQAFDPGGDSPPELPIDPPSDLGADPGVDTVAAEGAASESSETSTKPDPS